MTRKEYLGLLSASVLAGFAGAAFSSQVFSPASVFAQKTGSAPATVVAKEFRLVDTQGRQRAELSFLPNGSGPRLDLFDETGKRRVMIGCNGNNSFVSVESPDGTTSADMSASETLGQRASVRVSRGHQVTLDGGSRVLSNDQMVSLEVSSPHALAGHETPGETGLTVSRGHRLLPNIQLDVSSDGPSIVLSDSSGKDRAVLGTAKLHNKTSDADETTSPASLVLFSKTGDVIWSAPH